MQPFIRRNQSALHSRARLRRSELRATWAGTRPASRPNPIKPSCLLWRLPQELRDQIYHEVFRSTRLSHGKAEMSHHFCEPVWIRPAPHSLALLKTCRRVRWEIGKRWMGQVLFNFEDVETMMDKLSRVSREDLSFIRHVRVRGAFFDWELLPDEFARVLAPGFQYTLAHYLHLLPGLQLDTLTVLDNTSVYEHGVSHDAVTSLIQYGQGWKELRVISTDANLLGFSGMQDPRVAYTGQGDDFIKVRPDPWADAINCRDRPASQPMVRLYRYKQCPHTPIPVYREASYPYGLGVSPGRPHISLTDTYYQDNPEPETEDVDFDTNILIVVNRGKGVALWDPQESLYRRLASEKIYGSFETSWTAVKRRLVEEERVRAHQFEAEISGHEEFQQGGFGGTGLGEHPVDDAETGQSFQQYFDEYGYPEEYALERLGVRPHLLRLRSEDLAWIST